MSTTEPCGSVASDIYRCQDSEEKRSQKQTRQTPQGQTPRGLSVSVSISRRVPPLTARRRRGRPLFDFPDSVMGYPPMSKSFVQWCVGLLLLAQAGLAIGQTDAEIEAVFWQSVECESARQVKAYLEVYPTGLHASEAWACLEQQLGLDRAARILVQQGLRALEYEAGAADGLFGPATRQALRQWQAEKGFAGTGYLTQAQAETLMVQGRDAVAEQRRLAAAEQEQRAAERQRQEEETRRQAAAERQRSQPGETFRDCPTCPQMIVVPAGSFVMGSRTYKTEPSQNTKGQQSLGGLLAKAVLGSVQIRDKHGKYRGLDDLLEPATKGTSQNPEGPPHPVVFARPFAVGVYEVTVEEWEACVAGGGCRGYRPSDEGWGRGRRPVINVNWWDAQAYVEWLSQKTGKQYRLLSEAEWEYVARARTTSPWPWGVDASRQCQYENGADQTLKPQMKRRSRMDIASCDDGYAVTAPAGAFKMNHFGVYDVLGNVAEWVQDCWNGSYNGAPSGGNAWERGNCGRRVLRGRLLGRHAECPPLGPS